MARWRSKVRARRRRGGLWWLLLTLLAAAAYGNGNARAYHAGGGRAMRCGFRSEVGAMRRFFKTKITLHIHI
jgi:hypothetical protein